MLIPTISIPKGFNGELWTYSGKTVTDSPSWEGTGRRESYAHQHRKLMRHWENWKLCVQSWEWESVESKRAGWRSRQTPDHRDLLGHRVVPSLCMVSLSMASVTCSQPRSESRSSSLRHIPKTSSSLTLHHNAYVIHLTSCYPVRVLSSKEYSTINIFWERETTLT